MNKEEEINWKEFKQNLWNYLSFKEENPFFGICMAVILVIVLLGMAICGPSVTRSVNEKEAILKEESSIVYTGLLVGAIRSDVWFTNLDVWYLTLEGGAKIIIRESTCWLAPIGEEISIHKYNDGRSKSREHYIELEEKIK